MEAYLQNFLQQFQHLKIQLEELTSATNNFDDQSNYIGRGGFGKVYKGEVTHSKGRSMVAIKRLNPKHGQGIPEFLKEITTLSRYRHENLISLLGFCYQGNEMILVYDYASRGSLDRHLNSPHLTWSQRIKICLDAAKGLSYLHDPMETHQRLIHCDVKSANILLDDQWNGKVSDFGLSIMGPANEQQSIIVTLASGTQGYWDPQYAMTHTLTKESDVYSFGVVLFEVLCGRVCYTLDSNGDVKVLVPTWKECYEQKKLNDIIFKSPTIQPLDQSSLQTFSSIAYRCLNESREDRPKMAELVTKLETALEIQEFSEGKPPFDYEEMARTAVPSLNYSSIGELCKLLSEGVLIDGGKTWFSLNEKGEHCVMVSIAECLDPLSSKLDQRSCAYKSRFPVGTYYLRDGVFKLHVKTQFLSPGITYTVNLVFKSEVPDFVSEDQHLISLKYKLQGETKSSISYLAYERQDGWWMCELYQFTSDHRVVDLQIIFDGFRKYFSNFIEVEGIEFCPLEKVERKDEQQPISDIDANWEEKLPIDYEDLMKLSKKRVLDYFRWTTKKKAYSILCKGFLTNDGKKWFYLDKNGKKCHMLSVVDVCQLYGERLPLPESRFGEAFQPDSRGIDINYEIQSLLVSSETAYAAYLVYKFQKDRSRFEAPLEVLLTDKIYEKRSYIYLVSPQTPVIGPKADQNARNQQNRPKIKGLPQQRNDGWMEVQIWKFQTATTINMLRMHLKLISFVDHGIVIEGIEFRPVYPPFYNRTRINCN